MRLTISVLIVEDDPAMRQVIRNAVMRVPGVEVVAETGNGNEALKLYEGLHPRVVMVDIELPGKSGLDLAKEIFDINPWTYLVFCTGFSDYRDKAFEIYAFDYLVKPFKIERITNTMNRIISVVTGRQLDHEIELQNKKEKILQQTRLFKGNNGELIITALHDIVFFAKENRKTTVYLKYGQAHTDETLDELEKDLQKYLFLRTHKSFLINVFMARKIRPSGKYTHEIVMAHTQEKPLLSYHKLKQLENLISHKRKTKSS